MRRRTITITLAIHAALGVGWLVRITPSADVWSWWPGQLEIERLPVPGPLAWDPTRVAIRVDGHELDLVVYGSLDAPPTWQPGGPPVVYVYPDADVRVGEVVEALDRLAELVPRATIVITELRRKTTQPRTGGGDARPP